MILAQRPKAAARLSEQVRNRELKVYWAWCTAGPKQGPPAHYLVKDARTNTVAVAGPGEGKRFRWNTAPAFSPAASAWWRSTGHRPPPSGPRPVCCHRPSPYGDQKYGAADNTLGQQPALFCHQISSCTPTAGSVDSYPFAGCPPVEPVFAQIGFRASGLPLSVTSWAGRPCGQFRKAAALP